MNSKIFTESLVKLRILIKFKEKEKKKGNILKSFIKKAIKLN